MTVVPDGFIRFIFSFGFLSLETQDYRSLIEDLSSKNLLRNRTSDLWSSFHMVDSGLANESVLNWKRNCLSLPDGLGISVS